MSIMQYSGLNTAEVSESRQIHGTNVLSPAPRTSLFRLFLQKFTDPLIIILLIAGILSIGISFYEFYGLGKNSDVFIEPVGIFTAIFIATGLSFLFEHKAEKEFAMLNKVNDDEPVQVIRSGNTTEIPRKEVVVGDIILLSAGNEIPADARLIEATGLSVNESSLTGELLCRKTTVPEHFDTDATYPSDMVFRGTNVMEGHGIACVTAVGDSTENGKVFVASRIDNSVKTPLDEQLGRLGRLVSITSYIVGALVITGRIIMYASTYGSEWYLMDFLTYMLQSVMLAVTLVVATVPEGLPMAVTLSLAYSMRRLLRSGNLVRKLHACETMGAVTTICTDKTGTLTANQMRVSGYSFFGITTQPDINVHEWSMIMTAMALNSTAELDLSNTQKPKVVGNPTEGALLLWIREHGGDYKKMRAEWEKQSEISFSTERKYMASVITDAEGHRLLVVKGAPEIVFDMCSSASVSRDILNNLLLTYQSQAMRTLGFACAQLKTDDAGISDGEITSSAALEFKGIVSISDPVREDVPQAVRQCLDAGIKIKIVTGDTPATAREIGRRIGLWNSSDPDTGIVTGTEIEAMTDAELRDRVDGLKIIARARPMDKKRLVEALQARGEIVAVTGDGTNDAPALKSAHVGLSMGDGTSVAKEASDITILNNSFSGITNAVMWGRSLYRNIQRFILFQLTVSVAACLTVLIGSFMGTDAPLTVTQMLWINLVMDTFAAMALASLPPSWDVMQHAPRDRRKFIISKPMARFIITVGSIFFAVLTGVLYILEHSDVSNLNELLHPDCKVSRHLSAYELTIFFSLFVMLQMWNLFNARAFGSEQSALRLKHCTEFLFTVALVLFGQIFIVSLGGDFFNVTPLDLSDWIFVIAITSPVLLIGEVFRSAIRRRHHVSAGT